MFLEDTDRNRERISRIISKLLSIHPFFANLVLRLDVRETRTVATIACDGKNLFYNSDWVSEVQSSQLMTAIARLVLSCALKHHIRRKERIKPKWNEASRLVTLPIVKDAGLSTSREGERDKTAEQVYSELPDPPEGPGAGCPKCGGSGISQQGQGQGKGQGQEQGEGQGSGQGQGQEEGDGNGGEGGGGRGQGQEQGEGSGDVACECSDPNGEGTILDSPSLGNDAEMEEEDQEWSLAGQQAIQSAKAQGFLPKGLQEKIDASNRTPADWKELLRDYFTAFVDTDFTWAKPNRKFVADGVYIPGRRVEAMGKIVVAIDTSGSVDNDCLADFWTEIREIVIDAKPEETIVIQCDADISSIQSFDSDSIPETLEARGRGGTAFEPVFKHANNMEAPPLAMIYFTDFMVSRETIPPEPDYPVIWAIQTDPGWSSEVEKEVNRVYGHAVFIDPERKKK